MHRLAKSINRLLYIEGYPHSGWRVVERPASDTFEFQFEISMVSDGAGGVNLCLESVDGKYSADTNHESIESAISAASELYGIGTSEWKS